MAQRTQIYLDADQYSFLRDISRKEGRSMAQLIREWIDEKRLKKKSKKRTRDSLFKLRGIFTDTGKVAPSFDDYLYGDKK